MSDRYMVAVAFQEKFVDFIWCSNWSSKSLIMFSLWIASISDGVKSIEELYDRYGITEDYSERKEVIEEVITWPEHLIVVDLDKRDVYFNAECSVPYDAVQYQNWPIANM